MVTGELPQLSVTSPPAATAAETAAPVQFVMTRGWLCAATEPSLSASPPAPPQAHNATEPANAISNRKHLDNDGFIRIHLSWAARLLLPAARQRAAFMPLIRRPRRTPRNPRRSWISVRK